MKYLLSQLNPIVEETGFPNIVSVEKVVHLLNLLNTLNSHPALKGKLALKGGTALNLFVFDIPRLSVDIDLNYIGALDREKMLEDRPKVEQAMQAVFEREGFMVKRIPSDHAGGKWRLTYQSYTGETENLEVDINFMFRQPLWDVKNMDSHQFGEFQAKNIPVFNTYELYAGKLAALFSRDQARDLFDSHRLLNYESQINREQLRLAFIVYGAMNRKDWRTISLEDITFTDNELKQKLLPVLKPDVIPHQDDVSLLGQTLIKECGSKLSVVFPLEEYEIKFLDLLLDKGEIEPKLLTKDSDLQERIKRHPMLLWKALNVKKHLDL